MKVTIDTKNMTATLVSQYINSQQILSSSQGSMQILPNCDAPIGYGYDAAFTEFAPNGVMLCDTHFGLPVDSTAACAELSGDEIQLDRTSYDKTKFGYCR